MSETPSIENIPEFLPEGHGDQELMAKPDNYYENFLQVLDQNVDYSLEIHKDEPEETKWVQVDANVMGGLPGDVQLGWLTEEQAKAIISHYNHARNRTLSYEDIVAKQFITSFDSLKNSMSEKIDHYIKRHKTWGNVGQAILEEIDVMDEAGHLTKEEKLSLMEQMDTLIYERQVQTLTDEEKNDGG